jgi:glycosyltransferase involved in cell wall biosynthesis
VPFELEMMGQWDSNDFAAHAHRRIEELDLGKQIKFLGVLTGEDKFNAFRRASVFCFPTHLQCETFGLVLLEAMACGLPVVATRWRGIPSIVDEELTGFLIEPRDSIALADRLVTLANDAPMRDRMGRAGRAKFEREFTFVRHAERMRRALLATAGVAVEEAAELVDDFVRAAPIVNRSCEFLLQESTMTPQL